MNRRRKTQPQPPQRGGARPGAGRPPLVGDTPMQRYAVVLDEQTAERLREAGNGNLSAGIRLLARPA